jgi:hypothetical protein
LAGLTPVGTYRRLAEFNGLHELPAIVMSHAEVLKCLQVQFLELAPFGKIPVAYGTIFEKRASVEVDSRAGRLDRLQWLVCLACAPGLVDLGQELVAVYPADQLWVEQVAASPAGRADSKRSSQSASAASICRRSRCSNDKKELAADSSSAASL